MHMQNEMTKKKKGEKAVRDMTQPSVHWPFRFAVGPEWRSAERSRSGLSREKLLAHHGNRREQLLSAMLRKGWSKASRGKQIVSERWHAQSSWRQ